MASTRYSIDPLLAIFYLFLLFLQLSPTLTSNPKRKSEISKVTGFEQNKRQKNNNGQPSRRIDCRGEGEITQCYVYLHESGQCRQSENCRDVVRLFERRGNSVRIEAALVEPTSAASSSSITSNLILPSVHLALQQLPSSKAEAKVADYCHCKKGFFFKHGHEGECIAEKYCLARDNYPSRWTFVQQWPAKYNHHPQVHLMPITPRWSIHGLWPDKPDGTTLEKCYHVDRSAGSAEIFVNQLNRKDRKREIVSRLASRWPNYKIEWSRLQLNEDFWHYEWWKHGTCSQMTSLEYFYFASNLYDRYELSRLLEANTRFPLVPDNSQKVSEWNVSQAIMEAIPRIGPGHFRLLCEKPEYGPSRKEYFLTEVRLCFTAGYPKRFVPCTKAGPVKVGKKACPDEFYYGEPLGKDEEKSL